MIVRYVAFLRAINTGNRRVRMADLRRVYSQAGFADVATHLASGNVVFAADTPPRREDVERVVENAFGFHAEAFIRDEVDVRSLVDRVPWSPVEHLVEVSFLEGVPDPDAARSLEATAKPPEGLAVSGREVFFLREGKGIGTTHAESVTERMLGMRTTRRGMATILGIIDRFLLD